MKIEIPVVLELVKVLTEWMVAGRQFTCFDITRELRARKHNVDHQATREIVHSLHGLKIGPFAHKTNGSEYDRYTKSFMTSSGHSDTAEVYKRVIDTAPYNPDQHLKHGSVAMRPDGGFTFTISPVTSTTTVTTQAAPKVKKQKTYGTDGRGRVCVRADLLKRLGVDQTSVVFLYKKDGGILICRTPKPLLNYIGKLHIDKDSNVRISKGIQRRAGIDSDEFTMNLTPDGILLKAA